MDLNYGPDEERFRAKVKSFLETNLPKGWGSSDFGSMGRDEVAFLQCNADKDIDRSGGSEQQVPERHDGRSPECDQKAEIDRMPDHAIETGRLEADAGDGAADRVEHYLLHAE